VVKNTEEIAQAVKKILNTSPTGPGDISLLVAYMKMVDPGSTVRENEFATAQNAGGVAANVRNIYNRVVEGDKLPEHIRTQFRDEARKILKGQMGRYEATAKPYRRMASERGMDPARVVLDVGYGDLVGKDETSSSTVQPGDTYVIDGVTYRAKGAK
jgi:hypothetical protein